MFGSLLSMGAGMLGSYLTGRNQSRAAQGAADAQVAAAQQGIDEQRSAYQDIMQLLSPYSSGGTAAFRSQMDLTGVNGADAQKMALAGLESSPQFTALLQQGENAILANASATGGLRGGNTQGALMTFRPQLLADTINQQYERLGGLSKMGMAAGTSLGQFRSRTADAVTGLYGQQGSARAGGILGAAAGRNRMIGGITGALGQLGGYFSSFEPGKATPFGGTRFNPGNFLIPSNFNLDEYNAYADRNM